MSENPLIRNRRQEDRVEPNLKAKVVTTVELTTPDTLQLYEPRSARPSRQTAAVVARLDISHATVEERGSWQPR